MTEIILTLTFLGSLVLYNIVGKHISGKRQDFVDIVGEILFMSFLGLFTLPFIFLFNWIGEGLLDPLGRMIAWIGEQSFLPPQFTPLFGLTVFFLLVGLVSVPFRLRNYPLDRKTGKFTRLGCLIPLMFDWLVYVLDGIVVFLTAGAVASLLDEWPVSASLLVFPEASLTVKILFSIQALILQIVLAHILVSWIETQARPFAERGPHGVRTILWARCGPDATYSSNISVGLQLIQISILIATTISYRSNPYLPTVILCYLLSILILTAPIELISLRLDWNNDNWLLNLQRQLVDNPDVNQRLAAAKILGRLGRGKEFESVRTILRTALQDSDDQVRNIVQAELDTIKKLSEIESAEKLKSRSLA